MTGEEAKKELMEIGTNLLEGLKHASAERKLKEAHAYLELLDKLKEVLGIVSIKHILVDE
jgi:hypothetical protein